MLKNTQTGYGSIAKGFHWALFLLLSFTIVAGNFLASMPKGPDKFQAAGMHKSFGVILLLLIAARLAWRLINTTPRDPEGITPIQHLLSHAMHWGLYVLMFAQPLSGILMSQAAGFPVNVFGAFELPTLLAKNQGLAEFFRSAHGIVWVLMVIAVVGHIGAALFHHFVAKDDVLKRMSFATRG